MRRQLAPKAKETEPELVTSRWRRSDNGDTLIEVLLAIVVLGIASAALLLAFGTSITGSGTHRTLTTMDTTLRTATDATISQMTQSNAVFGTCSGSGVVSFTGLLPAGYTAQISQVLYWNGSSFAASCTPSTPTSYSVTANSPRLVTVTVTFNGKSVSISTVVDNPLTPTGLTLGAATHLVFLSQAGNEISGSNFNPQPVVAIEDSNNNVVTSDLSPVSLSITAGSGTGGAALSGCTATAYYGVVNFSGCTIVMAGSAYTLTASDTALASATSRAFNVSPGQATQVTFVAQPFSATGGSAFGTQPVVAVEDAGGNTVTTDTSSITVSITAGSGTSGAAFGCTSADPLNAVSGVATFSGCAIDRAGAGYSLTATDPGLSSGLSSAFTVSIGPAAQLAFVSSPGNATGGATFGVQPAVVMEDAGGNTVTTGAPIALQITSGTGTAGATLTCTSANPLTAVNGLAMFTGCSVNRAGAGYTLLASSSGLTWAVSNAFTISAGAPSQFIIINGSVSGPASASATLGPLAVQEEDAEGNPTTTAETVTLSSNSTGTAKFSATSGGTGISTIAIPAGSSSVNFYYGDTKAGSPTITASGALTSDPDVETITAAAVSQLVVTTEPPASSTAGTNFTTAVSLKDAFGNVASSSSAPITLAIGTNPGASTLTCGTNPVTTTNGVATFSCSLNKVGAGYTLVASSSGFTSVSTNAFNITAGAPSKFIIINGSVSGPASASATLGPLAVQEEDAEGNPTTTAETVTLSSNSTGTAKFSATSGGTGISTIAIPAGSSSVNFYYGDTKAGSPTITASGALTSDPDVETITAGSASKFIIINGSVSGPASASATLGPLAVQEEDAEGNPTTTAETVTLSSNSTGTAKFSATSGGTGISTIAIPAGSSSVNFYYGDTKAGSPTITASGALTSDPDVETITAAAVSQLVVTTEPPASSTAGTNVTTVVTAKDAFGNVASSSSAPITLAIGTNPGASTLTCGTNPVTTTTGVATFSCSLNKVGAGYTLVASSSGFTSVSTNAFNITAGAPSKFIIINGSVSGPASASATLGPLAVQEEDAEGNPTTTAETVTLSSNSTGTAKFSATSGGTGISTIAIPAGSSSVNFYYGDTKAGSPTITASGALTSDPDVETITAGSASGLGFTNASIDAGTPVTVTCTGTVGTTYACTLSTNSGTGSSGHSMTAFVTLIDQFGNPVVNSSGSSITVTLTASGGTISPTTVSIANLSSTSAASFKESLDTFSSAGITTAKATVNTIAVQATIRDR